MLTKVDNLETTKSELEKSLAEVKTMNDLQMVKSKFLGKKSLINMLTSQISTVLQEERKEFGQIINKYRQLFDSMIDAQRLMLENQKIDSLLNVKNFDPTEPYGNGMSIGSKHILTRTSEELLSIMAHLGFTSVSGPEVEDDYHNFTALNVPELHPARQMQDTFYVNNGAALLRTHTSSVQIRHMETNKPPHYIVSLGKVYRVDSTDQTHLPTFHHMECLCIDKDITMLDMKEVMHNLFKMFFAKEELPIRFRASYFPFTTPSMEVDIMYDGRWLELGGCGMVHRKVLDAMSINFEDYQGFAFGLGVERLAMVKNNITDIREFLENDIRFLKHYS